MKNLIKRVSYKPLVIIIASIMLHGCRRSTNGYDTTQSGLEYKYLIKKSSAQQVTVNDYLVLDVKYYTYQDSLLFSTESFSGKFRMKCKELSKKGDINEALGMMRIGDSMSFKVDAKTFFTKTRHDSCPKKLLGTKVRFEIALREIQNEATVKQLQQELTLRQQEKENILLNDFVSHSFPDVKPTQSGLYIISTKKGKGKKPKIGDKVTVHYIARFINGEIFTNSYRKNKPFVFTLGKKEVIDGMEEGILSLQEGGKAIIIIPSKLAYGEQGRKPVPPNTTIIFETELLSAK